MAQSDTAGGSIGLSRGRERPRAECDVDWKQRSKAGMNTLTRRRIPFGKAVTGSHASVRPQVGYRLAGLATIYPRGFSPIATSSARTQRTDGRAPHLTARGGPGSIRNLTASCEIEISHRMMILIHKWLRVG